jgi:phosphoglucosamine mutase
MDEPHAQDAYVQFALATVPENLILKNLHVVVDCGHGATYLTTPEVLRRLGARVTVLHDLPDGRNINQGCGSTDPRAMQEAVVRLGADLGLAHDGDGDRVILADEQGRLVDGDRMIGLCALHLKSRKELAKNTVVSTVMANLGFQLALEGAGIKVLRTAVGDRYVLEAMKRLGLDLGGEQSGHVIFRRHHATGDGLITALQVIRVMKESGKLLTELAGFMTEVPQLLVNVKVAKRVDPFKVPVVVKAIAAAEKELGKEGRVLVRMSGTEPKVRVMVEGPSDDVIQRLAGSIADALKKGI